MTMNAPEPPLALLAELTHRCPLRCSYCSNPLQLEPRASELDTEQWRHVLDQAAAMGALQVHFSGGEPAVRPDLVDLVAHAARLGLYTNVITSGLGLDAARIHALAGAGLEHLQLGVQDVEEDGTAMICGVPGVLAKKLEVARHAKQAGLALTINAVMTRHNAQRAGRMIDLAVELGAQRIEVANVQYYGWGLMNRAALIPSFAQMQAMTEVVEAARARLTGILVLDYVIPDYYARRPKACMGGWARRFLNVNPSGRVLPCHASETIPGLEFDNIDDRPLAEIWAHGQAFQRYRGVAGMPKACRDCDRKEIDWGGCRCQAMALAKSADEIDPTCEQSPIHQDVRAMAAAEAAENAITMKYRTLTHG